MKSKILILFFLLIGAMHLVAQERSIEEIAAMNLYYQDEVDFNFRLHTRGYSLGFTRGKIKTYYRTTYWLANFGELHHVKEYRQNVNPASGGGETSKSYVYGKQNSFFILRAGKGVRWTIGEKARKKGVSVALQGDLGAALGMLKPYYLKVYKVGDGDDYVDIKYSEENKVNFLNKTNIFGGAGFNKGLGELKLMPGIHGSFSSTFDWNLGEEIISAVDIGIMMDYFFVDVPIMVSEENQSLFVNVYLSLRIGKRW